ncbi:hypothetical protein HDA36_006137 [Nocardiopsis composta]|uniref:Uncharacterized protein n=1 Tax=Nocardiopsis composta TaxID=157465 RepID=A0A7W8QTL4_9ACTN|nr:hypothetical protein [Nocardiopsis composta]
MTRTAASGAAAEHRGRAASRGGPAPPVPERPASGAPAGFALSGAAPGRYPRFPRGQ